MYLKFYQLNKKPFSLAPDPEFLYLSQQHKDALGAIIYGIRERQGFVSVVGEVGTGKTTIVRSYLQKTERKQVLPIFIFNSRINFTELMKTFLREVGISTEVIQRMQSLNDMVRVAYKAMLDKTRAGHTIVLIVDEAQNMPIETLAKLCVLSNFETAKAKLIQIVLVGQPELQNKLSRHELRQLRQRIAYRAYIKPLSKRESADYMKHRLSLASKGDKALFTKGAIKKIVEHSKGVPRVINILCENCLVAGYGLQKKPVPRKIVKQVIAEYEGRDPFGKTLFKKVASSFLVLVVMVLLLSSYLPHLQPSEDKAIPVASSDNSVVYAEVEEPIEIKDNNTVTASVNSNSEGDSDVWSRLRSWDSFALMLDSDNQEKHSLIGENPLAQPTVIYVDSPTFERNKQSAHLKVVKKGDTVSSLCISTYGFVNTRVLRWIKEHNPHVFNLDEIHVDEILLFPVIEHPNVLQLPQRSNNRTNDTGEEIVSR